jgi:hypothetical protein
MLPWRYHLLCSLIEILVLTRWDEAMWASASSFAYCFLLRTCEWTTVTDMDVVPGVTLLIRDILFTLRGDTVLSVTFTFPSAKNDKHARGRDMTRVPCHAPVCMVTLLVNWLTIRYGSLYKAMDHPDEPLFVRQDGRQLTANYATVVRSLFKIGFCARYNSWVSKTETVVGQAEVPTNGGALKQSVCETLSDTAYLGQGK